jgi:hypothetical protein
MSNIAAEALELKNKGNAAIAGRDWAVLKSPLPQL